jgi:hypothetical protein
MQPLMMVHVLQEGIFPVVLVIANTMPIANAPVEQVMNPETIKRRLFDMSQN